jgi:uncharacterized OB-fold protein
MMMVPAVRDHRSIPFFEGAANGNLMIKRCSCSSYLGPERIDCSCETPDLEWVEATGTATLVSWIISHAWPVPEDEKAATMTVGLVELTEGPWMYAALLDIPREDLHQGLSLVVDFIHPSDGETIPAFRADVHEVTLPA